MVISGQGILKTFFLLVVVFTLFISNVYGSEIQYLHPIPGSSRLPVNTPIIVRFWQVMPDQIVNLSSFISVQTNSGRKIPGKIKAASDGKTVLFYPDSPHETDETITVRIHPILKGHMTAFCDTLYSFTTLSQNAIVSSSNRSQSDILEFGSEQVLPTTTMAGSFQDPVVLNGVSVPSDWPHVVVSANNPSDGYLFLSNMEGQPYLMILDNTGAPIWYMRALYYCLGSEVQPNGLMTMMVSMSSNEVGQGFGFNTAYQQVGLYLVNTSTGYTTNHHELYVLPNGNNFLVAQRETVVDMSQYVSGGQPNAIVRETIFQELTAFREIVLEWRAWDHFDIRDLNFPEDPLTGSYIRFPHMNSIKLDSDGHILLSSRHLSEITKINRYTGDIIWRLGGANNQFTFVNDPLNGFSAQHDIRPQGGGHYTLFDNGNLRSPPFSRAVEYVIDEEEKTATLVWQYRESPDKYSGSMGSVQKLSTGNYLIGWGRDRLPKITEVTPDGAKTFEMYFSNGYSTYRAYRSPWNGIAAIPYLIAEAKTNYITLIFNKFGDTDVAWYNVYGGLSPNPAQFMAACTTPFVHLKNEFSQSGTYYFRVKAAYTNGTESEFSNEVSAYFCLVEPGENMIVNGDFSNGFYFWDWYVEAPAQAAREITPEGVFHFNIDNGGSENGHVASWQPYLRFAGGKTYRLEFDAWAAQSRVFEAEIYKSIEPYTNFSRIGLIWLTPQPAHYSYQFVMTEPDESNAHISFYAGASSHDIFIDNISLKQVPDDPIPSADFEAQAAVGVKPFEAHFQDHSTGTISSWSWDFGDGKTNSERNPSHIYQSADTFTVSLTVTGASGSDIMTKENYIKVLEPPPVADFAADTTEGHWPFSVQFTNRASGVVTSWNWDFGDGEMSTEQNPSHVYQIADTFDVIFTVSGPGGADTLSRADYIIVRDPPPAADFEADTTRGLCPLHVQFWDLSDGPVSDWFWNFGDGLTSTEQNPSHTYSIIDSFTVSLIVTGPGGADTLTRPEYIVTAGPAPTAGFSADTTHGPVPLEVGFTDESIGLVDTWAWNFGDGTASAEQHTVHTFETVDTFSVRLIVSGANGADTLTRPDYIIVTDPPPVADFSAATTTGMIPLHVHFSDVSIGVIRSWLWDFGDSTTSSEQNPTHVYQQADTFSVSLTVSGPGGEDTKTLDHYIVALPFSKVEDRSRQIPDRFELSQNYPNPFNAYTIIQYVVPEQARIRLGIYNVRGECVYELREGQCDPGIHEIWFDASELGSGLYFYRMDAVSASLNKVYGNTKKMIILKRNVPY